MKTTIALLSLFCILFSFTNNVYTQMVEDWYSHYNYVSGNYEDGSFKIALSPSGNIYCIGFSKNTTNGLGYTLLKYTSGSSSPSCTTNYFPSGSNANLPSYATGIDFDNSGNVYITGEAAFTTAHSSYDVVTIKYNSSCSQIWSKQYNGANNGQDEGRDLVIGNDGHVYVSCNIAVSGGWDFTILKMDYSSTNSGNILWERSQNFDFTEDARFIDKDSEGNLYVVGFVKPDKSNNGDIAIMSYEPDGDFRWKDRYNGPDDLDESPMDLYIDANDNIYITGSSEYEETGHDVLLIKYDTEGNAGDNDPVWVATYDSGFEGDDGGSNIAVNSTGDVYVTGNILYYQRKAVVIKYGDSAPTEDWVHIFDEIRTTITYGVSITLDNSENPCVFGTYVPENQLNVNFLTFQLNSSGTLLWAEDRDFGGQEVALSGGISYEKIVVDANDNLFVIGISNSTNNGAQFTLIKYIPDEEDRHGNVSYQADKIIPNKYNLSQNYPNPFNPVTSFKFDLPFPGMVNLSIYDIRGSKLSDVANGYYNSGSHGVNFDASKLSSGVYFYRLTTNTFTDTKKMMLIK